MNAIVFEHPIPDTAPGVLASAPVPTMAGIFDVSPYGTPAGCRLATRNGLETVGGAPSLDALATGVRYAHSGGFPSPATTINSLSNVMVVALCAAPTGPTAAVDATAAAIGTDSPASIEPPAEGHRPASSVGGISPQASGRTATVREGVSA